MTLTRLSERFPNHPFTREAMASRVETVRHEVRPRLEKVARSAAGSAAASVVAEQVFEGMARRGTLPAVGVALASAALARSAVEGGVEAGFNVYHHRPWHQGVVGVAADGARKGLISGALYLSIKPIQRFTGRRFPQLTPTRTMATAGAVRGGVGGLVGTASNSETWSDGVGSGLGRVAGSTALGASRGFIVGGVSHYASTRWETKLNRWVDMSSTDGIIDWQDIILDLLKGSK